MEATLAEVDATGSGARAERRVIEGVPDRDELAAQAEKLLELRRRARRGTVTLVYSARDTEHNDAVVLFELLQKGSLTGRR